MCPTPPDQDAPLFDVGFVAEHFQVCNLAFELGKLRSASPEVLRRQRAAIVAHQKGHARRQAFADAPGISAHDALIRAVDFELLKRSRLFPLWRALFPVRRVLARWLRGANLIQHEYFGALPVPRNVSPKGLHRPVRGALQASAHWLKNHAGSIVAMSVAGVIAGLVLHYLIKA